MRTSLLGFHLPDDFLIGTANSAFQSEGACDRDGKSESIMEYYAREYAGKFAPDQKTSGNTVRKMRPYSAELPDRGCFFYDNYEEYIEDMKKTGQNTYRLSVAWCRIIPTGVGAVNPKGIAFYNRVIDKLLECGITPFVDLYHWDLPQCLMELGGFRNEKFPEWFEVYAKVCFEAFGDRVKMWSTFNESAIAAARGYGTKGFPPFIEDEDKGILAAHNCILAHYRAVRLYRSMNLGGKIGAVNCISAISPVHLNDEDLGAAERLMNRNFDWYTEVMLTGTYPQKVLRDCEHFRDHMPPHYQEDLDRWFVPMDFIGINYYVASRTQYNPDKPLLCDFVPNFYSAPGQQYASYPAGLMDVLLYVSTRYPNVDIYITENGCAIPNRHDEEAECNDDERVIYIREHLRMCARALRMGIPLRGYYYWNDADSYEELDGYNLRFGLTWVDHETGKRRWKKSRHYFSEICKTHMVD